MEEIKCTFNFSIFVSDDKAFSVADYKDIEKGTVFTAVGKNLPETEDVTYALFGEWTTDVKRSKKQFHVAYYEIPAQTGEAGIVAYLTSLNCGISRSKAKAVYRCFENDSWRIIEERPESLTEVPGITSEIVLGMQKKRVFETQSKTLKKICTGARIKIPEYKIHELVDTYGNRLASIIAENPYKLTKELNFAECRAIAKHMGITESDKRHLRALVTEILLKASRENGDVCLPKETVVEELMRKSSEPEEICRNILNDMYKAGEISVSLKHVYLPQALALETGIAKNIQERLKQDFPIPEFTKTAIAEYEQANFALAEKQKAAITTVMASQVSVITGGPGTGKTTVVKALLYTHRRCYGAESDPVLLAPTGKAANRMTKATGLPSQTVHSAVGYRGDDQESDPDIKIRGNIVLIDEASMLDQRITAVLLAKIPSYSRIVFIGDIDQLPSVGAGNILSDMIRSNVIPFTRLDVVYRQSGINPIVENADRINHGNNDLLWRNTFKLIETATMEETFTRACKIYLACVGCYGIDNVLFLNPQRKNTKLSVPALNGEIQRMIHEKHPEYLPAQGTEFCHFGHITYMIGDRVIQTRNTDYARNGDIGYITSIHKCSDETYITIKFDDNECIYTEEMLQNLELAYCTTVHKAQGSEAKTVIQIVSNEHSPMLQKKLIYTGVTRAKENLAIIGQKSALDRAIKIGQSRERHTLLWYRLSQKTNLSKKESGIR